MSLAACSSSGPEKESAEEKAGVAARLRESQATEATTQLRSIFAGARTYYLEEQVVPGSFTQLPRQFPGTSVGPTPPLGTCCEQGGKCSPNAAQWSDPAWRALQFSIGNEHYYSYEYRATDPESSFEIYAYGDLNCNGDYSTYRLAGVVQGRALPRTA